MLKCRNFLRHSIGAIVFFFKPVDTDDEVGATIVGFGLCFGREIIFVDVALSSLFLQEMSIAYRGF